MKLSIDIRPTKISAATKALIDSKINTWGYRWCCGGGYRDNEHGGGGIYYNARRRDGRDGAFLLVNYEKHRPKFSSDRPNGGKKTKITEGRWDAYVYVVPARIVRKAVQNKRNFTLIVG